METRRYRYHFVTAERAADLQYLFRSCGPALHKNGTTDRPANAYVLQYSVEQDVSVTEGKKGPFASNISSVYQCCA